MVGAFRIVIGFSFVLLIFGCNSRHDQNDNNGTAWGVGSFGSNGERIYFTATSDRGTSISYSGGPDMEMMMTGGKLACVSCHGIDAKGRRHIKGTEIMHAPDIRWFELSAEHHEEHEATEDNHEHEVYDFESFRNAVENGEHPDGDALKKVMPRWSMNDEDLHDLMDYLKSLK
jgi:hypothetical protein